MSAGYELMLAFDTDDPEFGRGVEAGRIYERARCDQSPWSVVVHTSNLEMMLRIADATDREMTVVRSLDNEWTEVKFA